MSCYVHPFAVCREFEELLHEKVPLEAYTDWLEAVINRCVIQVS